MLPALIGAGAILGGGLLGLKGGQDTNEANARQAQLNRDFQERMANTSFQRGVADIRKAGLNPALAYQQGGAHSPAGGQATFQNAAAQGVTSAAAAAQAGSTVAHTVAQIQKTHAETKQIDLNTRITDFQAQWQNALLLNRSEREAALTQLQKDPAYITLLRRQMEQDLRLTTTHAKAGEYELPGLRNMANAQESWWKRYVSPYLNDAASVTRIGASLVMPGAVRSGLAAGRKIIQYRPKPRQGQIRP